VTDRIPHANARIPHGTPALDFAISVNPEQEAARATGQLSRV
jgi:hypothetical protein